MSRLKKLRNSTSLSRPTRGPGGRFKSRSNQPEIPAEIRPEQPAETPQNPEIPANRPEPSTWSEVEQHRPPHQPEIPAAAATADPGQELAAETSAPTSSPLSAAEISDIPIQEPPGVDAGGSEAAAAAAETAAGSSGVQQEIIDRVLNRDEFFDLFVVVHFMTAQGSALIMRDPALRLIAISQEEHQAARKASDALYRLAEKFPSALGWMIAPGSETFVCISAIGSWGYGRFVKVVQAKAGPKARPDERMPGGARPHL